MNGTKSIFTSVTFYGTVLMALGAISPKLYAALGITDPGAAAQILVTLVGWGIAVYGRLRAKKLATITGKPAVT
jgi:hypothetical protein